MDQNEIEEDTKYCFNCRRDIPLSNHVMHIAYCHRNLKLCVKCNVPYLASEFEEHQKTMHTYISCEVCSEKLEAMELESHKLNSCPHRLQTCNFCDIDVEAISLPAHIDRCSSRTEICNDCGQFIMLKYVAIHKESHRLKKIPNVEKPVLDNSPESLAAYPPLIKKVPNATISNVRATTRTTSMPTLRLCDPIMTNHKVSPPVKRNNDQPQINTHTKNDITSKDPKKNMPIVDTPSDDDEVTILGAHSIYNNQSPNINNLLKNEYNNFTEGLKGVQLPCEFCQKMIESENLVMHETGCRPDLATFHNVLHTKIKNTNSQNDRFPVPPLDLDSSSSDSELNISTLSLSSNDDDEDDDSEKTNVEKLPCEFCEKLIPIKKLINHQINCEKVYLDSRIINNLDNLHQPPTRINTNLAKSVNIEESRRSMCNQASANAQSLPQYEPHIMQRLPRAKLNNKYNTNRVNISTNNSFVNNSARNNYEKFISNSRLNHSELAPGRENPHLYLHPSGGAIPKQKNMKSSNNRRVINDLSKRRDSGSSSD